MNQLFPNDCTDSLHNLLLLGYTVKGRSRQKSVRRKRWRGARDIWCGLAEHLQAITSEILRKRRAVAQGKRRAQRASRASHSPNMKHPSVNTAYCHIHIPSFSPFINSCLFHCAENILQKDSGSDDRSFLLNDSCTVLYMLLQRMFLTNSLLKQIKNMENFK